MTRATVTISSRLTVALGLSLLGAACFGQAPGAKAVPAAPSATTSVLGVRVGMDLNDAHAKLRLLGKSASGDEDADSDSDEGRKELWHLKATPFTQIALAAVDGRIAWVTGFVRPGQEIPFSALGRVSQAAVHTSSRVVWDVVTPQDRYRIMAGGKNGKAQYVSLIDFKQGVRRIGGEWVNFAGVPLSSLKSRSDGDKEAAPEKDPDTDNAADPVSRPAPPRDEDDK